MSEATLSRLADVVLVTHFAFVAFVVGGLMLIVVGGVRSWSWIRNPWFRAAHLAAIGIVVAQAWLGALCPLTSLEMHLRERAGEATYSESFIGHWLGRALYYDAPAWAFVAAYSVFGAVVAACWLRFPPARFRRTSR